MILEHIVEQHAESGAFLWHLRDLATGRPHYTLKDLRRLDDRVEANLDGLRIAGDAGWEIAKAALSDGEAGEMFVAAVLAVERHDLEGIALVLDASGGEPALLRGIASALGWVPFHAVERILPGLLDPTCPPALHWLGVAACAAHRVDPGEALARALESEDLRLRCRALDAVGELGRLDLRDRVERDLAAENAELRFRAASSAVVLGSVSAAEVLRSLAEAEGPHAEKAFSMAVRRVGPRMAAGFIESLVHRPEAARTTIAGVGALGDPAHVPWLLKVMATPDLARVAAEAYATIRGVDIEEAGLDGDPPEGHAKEPSDEAEDETLDPDEELPWPDVAAVRRHWQKSQAELEPGKRYFLGKTISTGSLREALRSGRQRQRAAAAVELVLLSPGHPLFEVRAPGFRQEVTDE